MRLVAFGALFGVPSKYYPYCGLIGASGWAVYVFLWMRTGFWSEAVVVFLATVLVILIMGFGMIVHVFYEHYFGTTVSGWSSILASIWLLGGAILLALGIIEEYDGLI